MEHTDCLCDNRALARCPGDLADKLLGQVSSAWVAASPLLSSPLGQTRMTGRVRVGAEASGLAMVDEVNR